MTNFEIIALIVTAVGVLSFAIIFTILYRSYSLSTIAEYQVGKRDVDLIDEAIFENQEDVKRQKKILRTLRQVLFYAVIVIVVPLFCFALVSKFSSGIAMIGGKGVIVVASGSMSERNKANTYLNTYNLNNQFNTYDLIVLEEVKPGQVKLYDVIAFRDEEGTNIIHRVIGFDASGKFITRGDSNNRDDEYHPSYEDVLGRYTGSRVPIVGMFVMFLQSYSGIVTIAAIIYCLIMIDRITNKIRRAQEERMEMLSSAIDFKDEQVSDGLKSEFTEVIYFKGFAYTFDEQGFVDKNVIDDKEMKEKSEASVIRQIRLADGEQNTLECALPNGQSEDSDSDEQNHDGTKQNNE